MATLFQSLGTVTALSSDNSFDSSTKFLVPSRRSLSERKASFVCVRSEMKPNPRARRADHLVMNAVATKADSSASSTGSKHGYE
ncbi:hypothetical protein TIFTF001_012439 [Ficus carica]|uniref:Uncharacterized protein n=1 Tax=Ficus carica TaxID=3494 RepID=A0AA88A0B5_FICCA|nr:hypothetical protein TIFTF001_012439 [Ficus carica]